jgi:predicted ribosome quality control (RQC) complex YloA/Tae2 family protein
MDITSFSLGISFAVAVGMLAVTVYNLFRVYKINKEIQSINQSANATYETLFRTIEETKERNFHDTTRIQSYLDSRLDKLIHRLDRLERERLGKSRDDEAIAGRVEKLQKELLND